MRIFELFEDNINYNFTNQHWQIRSDEAPYAFKSEKERVVLKNVVPYVDHNAYENGKKIYAYLQGTVVDNNVDFSNYKPMPVKFVKGDLNNPFVHIPNSSPVKHADYMLFYKNTVTAYYK